ncbi:hypothetical protein BCR32DRAFT_269923 [Anaeromyces robustus]|uniref:Rotatin N-terminal domain-containing protein n=1 Tax=Anaeromyces robustus TaxID=1754192 RepID=A0A1Y1WYY5_9FUNG|nr:hypothetical protein BCR32DRAFT_269923 [Anaeromyces robustus]|eukprot:ORX78713.1 hypothetical protein BCR32DRAFT_269923 [Anaeromyces robustus]
MDKISVIIKKLGNPLWEIRYRSFNTLRLKLSRGLIQLGDLYLETELYKNLLSMIVNDNIYNDEELAFSILSLFIELLQNSQACSIVIEQGGVQVFRKQRSIVSSQYYLYIDTIINTLLDIDTPEKDNLFQSIQRKYYTNYNFNKKINESNKIGEQFNRVEELRTILYSNINNKTSNISNDIQIKSNNHIYKKDIPSKYTKKSTDYEINIPSKSNSINNDKTNIINNIPKYSQQTQKTKNTLNNAYPTPLIIPNSIVTYNSIILNESDHSIINGFSSMLSNLIIQEEEENVFYYLLNTFGSHIYLQRSQLFRAIIGGLDPRSISRFEQSLKYLDILTIEWTKEFKIKIDSFDIDDQYLLKNLITNNNQSTINYDKIKNNINNFNKTVNNSDYYDDYSISIFYACHEIFSILVPFMRFKDYIDQLITIIYKIIPYLSFYIELVVNSSTNKDKNLQFENTLMYYIYLILEIIGYYTEDDEYYINQWNELLNKELNCEHDSVSEINKSKHSYNNMNNDSFNNNANFLEINKLSLENENQMENESAFTEVIYNREILIKLILDILCNLVNVFKFDKYSITFWNIINNIINLPYPHGIPSTLVNAFFNSNEVDDNDLNLLILFIKHPQTWVRKQILFELVQLEKKSFNFNLFNNSSKFNNLHSSLIKNFDVLINIINYGLQDNDIQINHLTKLFIKYFINSDKGNPILYNLILWLQLYDDNDILQLAMCAFNKIKDNCTFNKQIILWLRMLYSKDEKVRQEVLLIISKIFNEINELLNNQPLSYNIFYYTNSEINALENELIQNEENVYKKTEITDALLKTQILKTKALIKDKDNLKSNIEELLNLIINMKKENVKIKDDILKEINIFIVDIIVENSEILFNDDIIAKYFLQIFFIIVQYQNKEDQSFINSIDNKINNQFIKNLIILSFHPKRTLSYIIAKIFSYILFKADDYQLYFNIQDKNVFLNESLKNKICINNNLFPFQVINKFNIYNKNAKGVNIFNYRNNENLMNSSIQNIWKILLNYRDNILYRNNIVLSGNIFKYYNELNLKNLYKSKNHEQFFGNLKTIYKRCYCTQDFEFLPKDNILNVLKKFLSVPPATSQDAELLGAVLLFLSKFYMNNMNMSEWNSYINNYVHNTIYDIYRVCCDIIGNKENHINDIENNKYIDDESKEIDEICATSLLSNILTFIQSYLYNLSVNHSPILLHSNGSLSFNKYINITIQYIIKLCQKYSKFTEIFNQQLYWGLCCLLEFFLLPNLISNISVDNINLLIKVLVGKCREIQINNIEQDVQKIYYLLFENLRLISYYLLDIHISMKYEVNWEKYWLNENGYLLWLVTGMKSENHKIQSLSYGILANIIPYKGSYKYICLQAPQFIDLSFELLIDNTSNKLLKKELLSVINNFLVSFNDKIYKNYSYNTNGIEDSNIDINNNINESESTDGFIDEEQQKQLEILFIKSGFFSQLKFLLINHDNCLAYKISLIELLLNIAQKFKDVLLETIIDQELWEDLFNYLKFPVFESQKDKNETTDYFLSYKIQYYYNNNSDNIYLLVYTTLKLLLILIYDNYELEYNLTVNTSFVSHLQNIFVYINAYLCGFSTEIKNSYIKTKKNELSDIKKLDKFQCQVIRLSCLLLGDSIQQCIKNSQKTVFIKKSYLSSITQVSLVNVICEMIVYQNGIENKKSATYLLARLLSYYYESNSSETQELSDLLNSDIKHHYGCIMGFYLCREIYSQLINNHLDMNNVYKESLNVSLNLLLMHCQSSKKYIIEDNICYKLFNKIRKLREEIIYQLNINMLLIEFLLSKKLFYNIIYEVLIFEKNFIANYPLAKKSLFESQRNLSNEYENSVVSLISNLLNKDDLKIEIFELRMIHLLLDIVTIKKKSIQYKSLMTLCNLSNYKENKAFFLANDSYIKNLLPIFKTKNLQNIYAVTLLFWIILYNNQKAHAFFKKTKISDEIQDLYSMLCIEYPYITNPKIINTIKNEGLKENQKYLSEILKNIFVLLKLLDKKEISERIIRF